MPTCRAVRHPQFRYSQPVRRLQVHHADYVHANPNPQPLIPGAALAHVEQIVADASEVRVTSRELLFGGLMEHDGQSTGVAVVGLETDRLNRGATSLRQVVTGSDLEYGDTAAAILGEGVAQQLAVAPDQGVTLLVHTTAGAERKVALAIKGIVRTSSSLNDAYAIYVPLRFARQILDTDGAHRLLLLLRRERDLDAVHERLHRRISETG